MLPGVIERDALLQVHAGQGKLTQPEEGRPQRTVCCQAKHRVLLVLGQPQELLPQLLRPL